MVLLLISNYSLILPESKTFYPPSPADSSAQRQHHWEWLEGGSQNHRGRQLPPMSSEMLEVPRTKQQSYSPESNSLCQQPGKAEGLASEKQEESWMDCISSLACLENSRICTTQVYEGIMWPLCNDSPRKSLCCCLGSNSPPLARSDWNFSVFFLEFGNTAILKDT